MPTMTKSRSATMERKTISISNKRQITIPQSYFDRLGFDREAECIMSGSELIIRPVRQSGGEFAEQILADLIEQGYSDQELLAQFKTQQAKIRPAVERMIAEADEVAAGRGEYETYEDIFVREE